MTLMPRDESELRKGAISCSSSFAFAVSMESLPWSPRRPCVHRDLIQVPCAASHTYDKIGTETVQRPHQEDRNRMKNMIYEGQPKLQGANQVMSETTFESGRKRKSRPGEWSGLAERA